MNYIITVFLIGLVILAHESGHFIAARLVKLPIRIFSIGFGPKLWGFDLGGTEYRLSLFPFGGYVLPAVEDEQEFFALPVHQRLIMTIGGPVASILLPLFCFMIFNVMVSGFSVGGLFIKPFWQVYSALIQMLTIIPTAITHPNQLSGIVGIVSEGGRFIAANSLNGLNFLILISLNLAVLNLLPIPVLDGGKILLYLLEKIHPKFIRWHFPLAIAGWVFILVLTLYVTIGDISKFIGMGV